MGADEGAGEHLESLRSEYLDSLLRRAEMREDKAETEPAESAERKKLLGDAEALYERHVHQVPHAYGGHSIADRTRLVC